MSVPLKSHFSDADLLRYADRDLPTRRAYEIKIHLEQCPACRGRLADLEASWLEFLRTRKDTLDDGFASTDQSLAHLQARIAKLSREPGSPSSAKPTRITVLSLIAVAGVCVAFGLLWLRREANPSQKPDARLTPGLARSYSRQELCSQPGTASIIPVALATEVFQSYGIRSPKPNAYEMDYLITPSLGGALDSRNLWPQPYSTGVWNAHVKDALEDYLQQAVCSGSMDLGSAQQDIAADWIAAYRRHFKTKDPLPQHLSFSKDKAWE